MKQMKKVLLSLCVVALAFIWVGTAQANSISILYDLAGGQTVTAVDKLFDQWWFDNPNPSIPGQTPPSPEEVIAQNIQVTPLLDGGLDPGPGLDFNVLNNALGVTDGNPIAFSFFCTTTFVHPPGDLFIENDQ